MLRAKTIAVVMPAYCEEKLIGRTIDSVPKFVDKIIVVNDGSGDRTLEIILEKQETDPRVMLVNHDTNLGLGQSLIDGYLASRRLGIDVTVTMDGDGQMSPDDLPRVLAPVVDGLADYCKGNRLMHADVTTSMPGYRLFGNAALTFLTKFATGYWQLMDPQCAYAAISRRALAAIPIERMTKGYGYNADILNMLNVYNFRVATVEVKPVYGEEKSGIKLSSYVPRVSRLLVRLFFRRLIRKYLVRNFNPLCLSYLAGLFLLLFGSVPFASRVLYMYFWVNEFPATSFLCLMFLTIAGLQILLSAVQYDMEDNRDLFVMPPQDDLADQDATGAAPQPSTKERAVLGDPPDPRKLPAEFQSVPPHANR